MDNHVFAAFVLAGALVCSVTAEDKPPATPPPVFDLSAKHDPNDVVARVNGKEIRRKELDVRVQRIVKSLGDTGQTLPPEHVKNLEMGELDQMISRELVLQEGSANPSTNLDARVQAHMDELKTRLGGAEAMTKVLTEQGFSVAQLERDLRDEFIVRDTLDALVESQIKLTDDEVKTFYDSQRERFNRPATARASHILIRVPADATDEVKKEKRAKIDAARERLKKGEKFADVAKEVSEDPGSAAKGGDLGDFARGMMVPEFDKAAFEMKLNELSDVITTQFGYHVLIVTGRQEPRLMPFEEVKDNIREFLKKRKGNAVVQEHVKALVAKAKVEKLLK